MATTTNYGWTTPDDTALVKDGAAAIRTLGSSVDTTTKNLNPSTTLGDIEYRSSTANTNTRLGIGSTGDVLTVAGGVPSWAAPAGSGSNWTLLNSGGTALTGAQTITVSGISAKDKIMVLVESASSASTEAIIKVRLNTDTGSNYYNYGQRFVWAPTYAAANFISQVGADDGIYLGRVGQNAGSAVSGYALFSGCNSSGVKVFNAAGGATDSGSSQQIFYTLGGYYNSASTISSVSIFSATGNFDAGTVFIYTSA
jgi:hypothetical protein